MKCNECGGTYQKVKKDYYTTMGVYTFKVENLSRLECDKCKNVLLSHVECRKIERAYKKKCEEYKKWRKKNPL